MSEISKIVRNELKYSLALILGLCGLAILAGYVEYFRPFSFNILFPGSTGVLPSMIAMICLINWTVQEQKDGRFPGYALLPMKIRDVGVARALSLLAVGLSVIIPNFAFAMISTKQDSLVPPVLYFVVFMAFAICKLILMDMKRLFPDAGSLKKMSVSIVTVVVFVIFSVAGFGGSLMLEFNTGYEWIPPVIWTAWLIAMLAASVVTFSKSNNYVNK